MGRKWAALGKTWLQKSNCPVPDPIYDYSGPVWGENSLLEQLLLQSPNIPCAESKESLRLLHCWINFIVRHWARSIWSPGDTESEQGRSAQEKFPKDLSTARVTLTRLWSEVSLFKLRASTAPTYFQPTFISFVFFFFSAALEVHSSHLTSCKRTALGETLETHKFSLQWGNVDLLSKKVGSNPQLPTYSCSIAFDLLLQTKFVYDSLEVHVQIPRYHISEGRLCESPTTRFKTAILKRLKSTSVWSWWEP